MNTYVDPFDNVCDCTEEFGVVYPCAAHMETNNQVTNAEYADMLVREWNREHGWCEFQGKLGVRRRGSYVTCPVCGRVLRWSRCQGIHRHYRNGRHANAVYSR